MKKTLGILTGLLLTGSAHAASFQYGNYTVVDQQNIQVLTPNNISGGMGEIILQGAGADINKTLAAWCIDLFDHLQHSATYNITPLTTAGVGAPNPTLTQGQIGQLGSLMIHGAQLSPSASDHNTSAAFQLAIWMVEYGAAFSFSGVSTATIDLAGTFIANVQTNGIWDCPTCTVSKLDSGYGNQTLAFGDVTPGTFDSSTPIPGAVWLFGTVLAGGAGFGRWRKKRKAQLVG